MILSFCVWGLFRTVNGQLELAKGTASASAREAKRFRRQHPDRRVMRYKVVWDGKGVRTIRPLGVVLMPGGVYQELRETVQNAVVKAKETVS